MCFILLPAGEFLCRVVGCFFYVLASFIMVASFIKQNITEEKLWRESNNKTEYIYKRRVVNLNIVNAIKIRFYKLLKIDRIILVINFI